MNQSTSTQFCFSEYDTQDNKIYDWKEKENACAYLTCAKKKVIIKSYYFISLIWFYLQCCSVFFNASWWNCCFVTHAMQPLRLNVILETTVVHLSDTISGRAVWWVCGCHFESCLEGGGYLQDVVTLFTAFSHLQMPISIIYTNARACVWYFICVVVTGPILTANKFGTQTPYMYKEI